MVVVVVMATTMVTDVAMLMLVAQILDLHCVPIGLHGANADCVNSSFYETMLMI